MKLENGGLVGAGEAQLYLASAVTLAWCEAKLRHCTVGWWELARHNCTLRPRQLNHIIFDHFNVLRYLLQLFLLSQVLVNSHSFS